jgi:hypothetical protein
MRVLLGTMAVAVVFAIVGCGSSTPSAPADPAADKQADEENRKNVRQQEGRGAKGKTGEVGDELRISTKDAYDFSSPNSARAFRVVCSSISARLTPFTSASSAAVCVT